MQFSHICLKAGTIQSTTICQNGTGLAKIAIHSNSAKL